MLAVTRVQYIADSGSTDGAASWSDRYARAYITRNHPPFNCSIIAIAAAGARTLAPEIM
jgi:hypothetical protein